MKLTEKDKTFLENLKKLMESKCLWVGLKSNRPSYMVLKGTYGEVASSYFCKGLFLICVGFVFIL